MKSGIFISDQLLTAVHIVLSGISKDLPNLAYLQAAVIVSNAI